MLAVYLRPQWRLVAGLSLALTVSTGLQLVNPQVLRRFIDVATGPAASAGSLSEIALLFIGIALVQQALTVAATYLSLRVGWAATNALRLDLARHCLRLDSIPEGQS